MNIPTPGPITVFITEHDDETVKYVVNSLSEMQENFDDLLDETNEDVFIRYPGGNDDDGATFSPSEVLAAVDKIAYDQEFSRYCEGWTKVEMPFEIYFATDEQAPVRWLDEHL